MSKTIFEWDEAKSLTNVEKHRVSFYEAQFAFLDENRLIAKDLSHSENEDRFFCFGLDRDGSGVPTVRFTYRSGAIRIFGAGYWRKGKKIYEQTNSVH
ncbi:MAG TPA: BrnT family toxin [Thermodesulfobacteriota bacterium]|nr:BrnT family toxin [Thermodesulfobacteriota bacterium]